MQATNQRLHRAARWPPSPAVPSTGNAQNTPGAFALVQRADRDRVLRALLDCAGNQTRAAKQLGTSRTALVTKLALYRIPRPRYRSTGAGTARYEPIEPLSTIAIPASRISASARSPSPGFRSTARQPSSITQVSKPRFLASIAVAFTQKSVASPIT